MFDIERYKQIAMSRTLYIHFLSILITLTCSCKKSDNAPEPAGYYLRFKLDGVVRDYKADRLMTFGKSGTNTYFLTSNVRQGAGEFPVIRFDISSLKQPATAPQTFTATNNSARMYYGESRADEFASLSGSGDFKLELTEKTETSVKGTFSGTVIETYVYVPLEKKITEGTFFLQVVNR